MEMNSGDDKPVNPRRFEQPDKTSKILMGAAFALVAITWLWLFKGKWPLGVRGEWVVEVGTNAWPAGAWGLPIAALGIFGGFAAISAYDRLKRAKNRREQIASTKLSLLGIFLLALVWPWALLGPGGTSNLIASQWSDISNEYFSAAQNIDDPRQFTQEYAATRQQPDSVMLAHVATHPPGAVLFYYGARYLYEASPQLQNTFSGLAQSLTGEEPAKVAADSNTIRYSAAKSGGAQGRPRAMPVSAVGGAIWSAFLISLCLALATPAVYLIGASRHPQADEAETIQAETRGLIAAALWAACPTANLFAFTLDAVIAASTAWTLVFLALRWRRNHRGWLLLCGITMALTSFISFGALAVGLILLVSTVYLQWQRDGQIKVWVIIKEGLLVGLAFALTWLFIIAIFPFSPLHVFGQAMEAHRFATVNSRSRFAWTFMNVVTFSVFLGWPLVIALVRGIIQARHETGQRVANHLNVALGIGICGLLTLLLLTLSGKALGEVERLWMFLAPSLAILAAYGLMQRANAVVIGTYLALQASQTLLMAAWLWPIVRPL